MKSASATNDSLPPDAIDARATRKRRRASKAADWLVNTAWISNLAALVAFCVWILLDGRFPTLARLYGFDDGQAAEIFDSGFKTRFAAFYFLVKVPFASFGVIAVSLFFGASQYRSIRAWLGLMAALAAWLTLWGNWSSLAWWGQQQRVAHQVPVFEPIARTLLAEWPTDDGTRPELGPFTAYPKPRPRTLLRLGVPQDSDKGARFVAVEKSPDGAIRFEMLGVEQGSWMEWHPPGSFPRSFIGGLEVDYVLRRSAPLHDGWWLAQYQASYATAAKH